MDAVALLVALLRVDPVRWHLLGVVRDMHLPDGWIGAGFVRNAIWDHLHGRSPSAMTGDVDVLWHDRQCVDPAVDRAYEARLRAIEPSVVWSVKNQARMHGRNGDRPYPSAVDAMRYWPETATAVAVRRIGNDDCDVAAPFGLDDLMGLVLRPTPGFAGGKRVVYEARVRSKRWLERWPLLIEREG